MPGAHPYGTINISRPLSAYGVPVSVVDPGADGRVGSADDGPTMTAYGLLPEALAMPPVNVTMNLPNSDSEYYTWEVTASRRQAAWGSLLASFTRTWNREAALGTGNDFTPNALVNATGNQLRFTTWQAKLHATVNLPADVRLVPVVRSQSGTPYRTNVRPHAQLRQCDHQGGTDRRQPHADHHAGRSANREGVPRRPVRVSWDSSTSTTSSTRTPSRR